jgi:hypothetical protein
VHIAGARFCRASPFAGSDAGTFYRENEPGARFPPASALDRRLARCTHNQLLLAVALIRAGSVENRPVATAFMAPLLPYLSAARGNKAIKI